MTALMPPRTPSRVPRSPRVISRPPAKRRIVRGSDEPERRDRRAARRRRRHRRRSPNGVPGRGFEEVQRHLVRLELGELRGELGPLLERLAHADDAAAAQLHAGLAHHLAGLASAPRRSAW